MQRVTSLLPSWDRRRSTSTPVKKPIALDKVFGWAEKISVPGLPGHHTNTTTTTSPTSTTNGASDAVTAATRYGRETYWPAPLDKECDKAARILKSFCVDGFLAQEQQAQDATEPPSTPSFSANKIPPRVIQDAVGLAVFSCMRSGLWMSGSGGAGMITARKADGTWSPPSGIILHTAALGFVLGVDIYDCVLIINSVQTLELFTRPRLTLGADVNLTVGPLVKMGTLDHDIRWKGLNETVLTYVKARGKHQAVQLDGSMVTERGNENGRFYCGNVSVLDILAGNIPKSIPEMRPLFEVIKAAEGRSDYDTDLMELLAQQPAPGDAVIETPGSSPTEALAPPIKSPFGIPDVDDPDPFGVIGLEMAGIEIREAGTHLRPVSTQFEFNPSPTSPVFARFSRQSTDTFLSRSNRGSCMSSRTQATAVTDVGTQTDVGSIAETSFSRANSDDGRDNVREILPTVMEPDEVDYTKIDTSMIEQFSRQPSEEHLVEAPSFVAIPEETIEPEAVDQVVDAANLVEGPTAPPVDERNEDADDEEDEDEDEEEEPIICEVAVTAQPTRTSIRTSQVTQVIQAKGALVTIPKRIPPPLPARSPARTSRASRSDYGGDVSSLKSPLRSSFLSAESRADDSQVGSDGTAETSPAEAFVFPPAVREADAFDFSLEAEKLHVQKHRKNTSSVYTAVNEISERPQSADIAPPAASALHDGELPSSPEESELEPRTPKSTVDFINVNDEKTDMVHESTRVSIISNNAESASVVMV
ncbi:hypothetical protein B0T22DRAFT_124506 [Podospora appendiculata]|uniref:Ysc84 actin-binding domain-containing protein n=1 Tax=Podospora appendiculata TaxID=314037 RepID=A0AAE0X780_9PEZI|nr:hypothetical protein B0T22DRAFT_124506 [Podospora appendiculata]